MTKTNRLWELDALRGVMILMVVYIHLCFDLDYFLGIDVVKNPVLQYCMDHCGVSFVALSGLSATIGRRSFRRGLQVFGCGMVITVVTAGMYLLNMADKFIIIYFGVLHLLGVCMMLWVWLRKLPLWARAVLGVGCVLLGRWFMTFTVSAGWLFPLGLTTPGFSSSDFFPLFPGLGWFLLGSCAGSLLYKEKRSLLPNFPAENFPVRFFRFCGTHSLWIYLIHQPVLYGIVSLIPS